MKQESDAQLIDDILSGDDAAFNALVKKYQKSVHALVWRKIGDFHYREIRYRRHHGLWGWRCGYLSFREPWQVGTGFSKCSE